MPKFDYTKPISSEDRRSLDFLLEQGLFEGIVPGDRRGVRRHQVDSLMTGFLSEAFSLSDEEERRRKEQLGFERGEFDSFNADFEGRQTRLSQLFRSKAADAAGAEARTGLRNVRSFIGARGLNPNSGTAAALAADVASRQQGQLIGARRDIALDEERRRRDHALTRLQGSQRIGDIMGRDPSVLKLDAIGDVLGVQRAREQEAGARDAAKGARRDAMIGAGIGGLGSIAGAFI